MFGAISKATNSSFQRGMTFGRSIFEKKVMKLLAFIFEQSSYPYSIQATNRPNRHELIFYLFGGIREVSLFFSPIVMFYESFPTQIRFRYEYSGESAQFGWNRAKIHYD